MWTFPSVCTCSEFVIDFVSVEGIIQSVVSIRPSVCFHYMLSFDMILLTSDLDFSMHMGHDYNSSDIENQGHMRSRWRVKIRVRVGESGNAVVLTSILDWRHFSILFSAVQFVWCERDFTQLSEWRHRHRGQFAASRHHDRRRCCWSLSAAMTSLPVRRRRRRQW